MTQEIIEMARQAKLLPIEIGPVVETSRMRNKIAMLEAFAKLVDAKATAREREACAKVADGWSKRDDDVGAFIGKAIRARGEA